VTNADLEKLARRTDTLLRQYQQDRDRATLTEAVRVAKHALDVCEPQWAALLGVNLASALRFVAEADQDEVALRESVMLDERFVAEAARPEQLLTILHRLAGAYRQLAGSWPQAVAGELYAVRRAAAITDPGRVDRLYRLRALLSQRHEETGDPVLLPELAQVFRDLQAETSCPVGSPEHVLLVSQLAVTLRDLHKITRELAVLNECIDRFREVAEVELDAPLRSMFLGELGRALLSRYVEGSDRLDLDAALRVQREAVKLAGTGEARAREVLSLGNVHRALADLTGSFAELRQAIALYREALPGLGERNSHRGQASLADALARLGQLTGEPDLVREAAEMSAAQRDTTGRVLHWRHLLADASRPDVSPAEIAELVQVARDLVADATSEERPYRLSDLSTSLRCSYLTTDNPETLAEAVETGRAAVAALSAGQPHGYQIRVSLGETLCLAAEGGDLARADEAVALCTQALTEAGLQHPDRPTVLGELATAQGLRYEHHGEPADLRAALNNASEAVAGATTRQARLRYLPVLAILHARHALALGDPAALDAAIARCQDALALALSRSARMGVQYLLVRMLVTRLHHSEMGAPEVLAKAREGLQMCREALAVWPPSRPGSSILRVHLVALLMLVATHASTVAELRAVATAAEQLTSSDDGSLALRVAGNVYARLAEMTWDHSDFDAAIRYQRCLVDELAEGDPERILLLSDLGRAYGQRLVRSESGDDADDAVRFGQAAMDEAGPKAPDRARLLATQSGHLGRRFRMTGRRTDLRDAELTGREAEAAATSPAERIFARTRLVPVLMLRYQADRDAAALDEAIKLGRSVVEDVSVGGDNGLEPATLAPLSYALRLRHQLHSLPDDLDESIALMRRVTAAVGPEHPGLRLYLSDLAMILLLRYEQTNDPADHRAALEHVTAAVDLVSPEDADQMRHVSVKLAIWQTAPADPDSAAELDRVIDQALAIGLAQRSTDPSWSAFTHNLGTALLRRHERTGDAADLDQAIEILTLGLDGSRTDDPQLVSTRVELGNALSRRDDGDGTDLEAAVRLWREASEQENGPSSVRLEAVLHEVAELDGDSAAQLPLFRKALTLLSVLAWHGTPRVEQQRALSPWSGLASAAAAAALDIDSADLAVELLEQGRAVLWSQLLDSQADLGEISRVAPELAKRMQVVRTELDTTVELLGNPPPAGSLSDPAPLDPFAAVEVAAALKLARSGNVADAEEIFARYADTDHPDLTALCALELGLIRTEQDDREGAITFLSRSLATGSGRIATQAGKFLAAIHLNRGDHDQVRKVLQDVLHLDADEEASATAREGLAALDELERDPTGLRLIVPSVLASNDPDTMMVVASRLLERGEFGSFQQLIERAREVMGDDGRDLDLIRGVLLAGSGDVPGAIAAWRSAAASPQAAGEAILLLSDLILEEGDPDEAFGLYRQLAAGPDADHALKGRERLATLDLSPVVPPACSLDFDYPRWLAYNEPPDPAAETLRAAVLAGDRTARTQLYLALVSQNKGRDAVVAAFRLGIVLGSTTQLAVVEFCRGSLRGLRGDRTGAIASFSVAYDLAIRDCDPELAVLATVRLAQYLDVSADPVGAEAAYRRAVTSGQWHLASAAGLDLARMLSRNGERDRARAVYRQVFEMDHPAQSPMAGFNLASILCEDGDDETAAKVFRRVIEGPRPDVAAHAARGLGKLLTAKGDLQAAAASFRRAITFGVAEESAPAAYHLGLLLANEGDHDAAAAAFMDARSGPVPEVSAAADDALRALAGANSVASADDSGLIRDEAPMEPVSDTAHSN
jgi:tetratricopeptide (TPR) repeat protein